MARVAASLGLCGAQIAADGRRGLTRILLIGLLVISSRLRRHGRFDEVVVLTRNINGNSGLNVKCESSEVYVQRWHCKSRTTMWKNVLAVTYKYNDNNCKTYIAPMSLKIKPRGATNNIIWLFIHGDRQKLSVEHGTTENVWWKSNFKLICFHF